jgi:hypothetical protein
MRLIEILAWTVPPSIVGVAWAIAYVKGFERD